MATIRKIGKDHALRIAKKASAEIIYDIIKLEDMQFTLQEVQAVMSDCETVEQGKSDEKKPSRK